MRPLIQTSAPRGALLAGLLLFAGQAAAQPEPRADFTAQESAAFLEAMAPTNAALVYYQLFLQDHKTLNEGFVHFNLDEDDDENAPVSLEEAQKAFDEQQHYIENLIWASNMPDCDWGVQYQQGWRAILPHLGKLREAARVLGADARRQFAAGGADKGAERLAAIYNMARHASSDRILICALVGAAMNGLTHGVVNEAIESGRLTEEGRDLLISSLERFSDDDPLGIRACVVMEGAISVGWIVREFPEGRAGTTLAEWGLINESDAAQIRRLDAMNGPTLRREAERMTEYHRQALQVWDDPDAVAKLDALGALVEAGAYGQLAEGFGAAFGKAREAAFRAEAELDATLAALRAYKPEKEPERGATSGPTKR